MANFLLTIDMITREAVRLWRNTNAFLQNVDMQYDDSFAVSGAKIGSSLRIRLPNDFTVATGPAGFPATDSFLQYGSEEGLNSCFICSFGSHHSGVLCFPHCHRIPSSIHFFRHAA